MKKWVSILTIAYLLLVLCGCARQTEQLPPPEVPAVQASLQTNSIVTEAGQAETRVDPFARTAIIARNAWLQGSFVQTKQWALEYAQQRYPQHTSITADYTSGYVLPGAMVPEEGLSGGVAVWDMTIQQQNETISEQVQVFYFSEQGSDGYQICLSGLLTGEDMRMTRPKGYAYLMLDTRFSGRVQSLPRLEGPEGALELEFLLEREAVEQQFYPLNEQVVAVLCRYSHRFLSDDKLLVYDLESGEVLLEEWLPGFWSWAGSGNGWVELEYYYAKDEMRLSARVTLTEEGAQLEQFSQPYGQYRVGDHVLTWKDERVLLGEDVLLGNPVIGAEGQNEVLPEVPDDEHEAVWEPEEVTMYNFHQALDDHRFLFSKATLEWIAYYGIYDLETREMQVLTGSLQPQDFHVLQVSEDGSRALMAYGSYRNWGLTMVDLQTMERRLLPLEYNSEDNPVERVTANADLSRIAVTELNAEDSGMNRIRVFDTTSGEELFYWESPARLISGEPEIVLVGDHTLMVNVRQWRTDTEWVYRVSY